MINLTVKSSRRKKHNVTQLLGLLLRKVDNNPVKYRKTNQK